MSCSSPLLGYRAAKPDPRTGKRKILFSLNNGEILSQKAILLPCGQCFSCRLERSRQWAMRCLHESQLHKANCFITLTYANQFLPSGGSLVKRDFQRFIKRLRKKLKKLKIFIRYFHCGEYGESLQRPHYHALLFGYDFPDKRIFRDGKFPLYTSDFLSTLWPYGHSSVGDLTFSTAAYTARYAMKKVTGDRALDHYKRIDPETGEIYWLQPEYVSMSLKPAIGKGWFDKFSSDVYPSDFVLLNGRPVKTPKYYDKLFDIANPDAFLKIKRKRILKASAFLADSSPERLKVRERVKVAQTSQLKRHEEI